MTLSGANLLIWSISYFLLFAIFQVSLFSSQRASFIELGGGGGGEAKVQNHLKKNKSESECRKRTNLLIMRPTL